jgi:hypothetical protein
MSEATKLEPLPDYGDLFAIAEFRECCEHNSITEDDGTGYYATATHMTNLEASPAWIARGVIDHRWSHVMWFNK